MIKDSNLADTLIDISRTKLDVVPSQNLQHDSRGSHFVQNGCQRLFKTSYPIGPTCNNGHSLDPSNPESQINTHKSVEFSKVIGHFIIL